MRRDPQGLFAVLHILAPSFLARVAGYGFVGVLLGGFLWASPASPLALVRPDVLLGQGRALEAVATWDAIARTNPLPGLRDLALDRAATTWAVALGEPREARFRLEARLRQERPNPERAVLLARIGELLVLERDPAAAAVRFREAHDLDPGAREAGGRLRRAAEAAGSAGDPALAEKLWRRLGKTHPEHLAASELGRAEVALHRGEIERALAAFRSAQSHTYDPDLLASATLGANVCLERLGDLEEALAELADAELPPDVHARREAGLAARLGRSLEVAPPPARSQIER
jgi:tetratricopeptide (TPR) repeat protein